MAKKKYVVIYNNEVYVFYNWPECNQFVKNKKNILYKSFKSPEEDELARQYIDLNIKRKLPFDIQDVLYAYVDGSYKNIDGKDFIGYGVAFVKNLKEIGSIHGRIKKQKVHMNQVNGELHAVSEALKKALEMKEKRIIIVYDFIGIEAWINGSWKINNDIIQQYVDEIKKYCNKLTVDFIKVDSHKNKKNKKIENEFNDRADELAKMCWSESN